MNDSFLASDVRKGSFTMFVGVRGVPGSC